MQILYVKCFLDFNTRVTNRSYPKYIYYYLVLRPDSELQKEKKSQEILFTNVVYFFGNCKNICKDEV